MEQVDAFHFHEVVHLSSFLASVWDDNIAEHPAVKSNPEFMEKANQITKLMGEFYQNISLYSFDNFPKCNCINGKPQTTAGCPIHGVKF